MKTLFFSFVLLLFSAATFAQTTFKPDDIFGDWRFENQYDIRIEDHTAVLHNIHSKNVPQKLRRAIFYHSINHKEGNIWTANKMQWRYTNGDINDGRWIDDGETTFTMSEDKMTFTNGTRVFKRMPDN